MDGKTNELIAIGASIGAHCQPCLEYHIKAALESGVELDDIKKAIEIGHQVEKGSMAAMRKYSDSMLKEISISARGAKKILEIYDPAMCCSSGVCGSQVDPDLSRFAGALQTIAKKSDVAVERYNLAQQPQAFVENETVKSMLANGGDKRLPYIFVDGKLFCEGRYPSRDELFGALGLKSNGTTKDSPDAPSEDGSCSCGGCCG